jgi:hypothetical protein
MSNPTETLTAKLHARSDRRLEAELSAWLDAMPPVGYCPHNIPCGNGANLAAVLYMVKESVTRHLAPIRRGEEVSSFMAQVNLLQDVLDNK